MLACFTCFAISPGPLYLFFTAFCLLFLNVPWPPKRFQYRGHLESTSSQFPPISCNGFISSRLTRSHRDGILQPPSGPSPNQLTEGKDLKSQAVTACLFTASIGRLWLCPAYQGSLVLTQSQTSDSAGPVLQWLDLGLWHLMIC